ncbi:MAG: tetratricopeptide repeat-containing sensor histidine kinase [Chitinophagales bacterium]|nr:tetratricopeptide repeat-containing sensor histidine kinase [Chitinophagales bacterium]
MFILFIASCKPNLHKENKKNKIVKEHFVDSILTNADKLNDLDIPASLQYIDSAIAGKKLTLPEKIQILNYRSFVCDKYLNDFNKANLYADSMLFLLEGKSTDIYLHEFVSAYFTKGDILFRQKKFSKAYPYYYQGKQLGESYLDSCSMGEYNYRIGFVLYTQESYEEAKTYFLKTLPEWKSCNIDFGRYYRIQEIMNNIGLCYEKLNMDDSALYYFKNALNFINENKKIYPKRKNKHLEAQGVIFGNIGDIYKKRKDYDSAYLFYKKSVDINLRKNFDLQDGVLTYLKIASLYYIKNKPDSMKMVLTNSQKILDTLNFSKGEIEWLKLMWQYFDSKNNIIEAYKYLNLYNEKNTKYTQKIINEIHVDIGKQVDFIESKHQIQLLENDNKLSKIYLKAFIIIVVLAVIALLIFMLYWIRSRKDLKKIKELYGTIQNQNKILENALEESEEKSREKEKIIHIVAHDLRTPVASISSLVDLILEEKDEQSKKDLLNIIKEACNNSISLIGDILKSSEMPSSAVIKSEVHINQCLNDCVFLLTPKASEKNQIIVAELLPKDALIYLDKDKMKRVIYNLVINAIKFSYPNSKIVIKAFIQNNNLVIAIKDDGIGIPTSMQNDIFNAANKATREGTSGEQSYGLGLSICKQIIEAHNGKIWVKSKEGKGSTFYMQLPIK